MRLIDADALLEELKKTPRYFVVKADIDNAPTVEDRTQEVLSLQETIRRLTLARPQGEWIIDDSDTIFGIYENYMKCSICNEYAEWLDGGSQFLSNFCPNCGAKMQKGGAE